MTELEILNLFLKYFDLFNETAESLSKKLNIIKETKNRFVLTKTNAFLEETRLKSLGYGVNEAIILAFKKYANEDSLDKYMQKEGYQYKDIFSGNLMNIMANKFIIYPNSDEKTIHNKLKKLSSYNYWEFENFNEDYRIAYN